MPSLRVFFVMAVWAALLPTASAETAIDQMPVMECRVEQAQGSFMGYLPPKFGDRIVLKPALLQKLSDKLQFAGGHYIPLNGELKILKEERSADGAVRMLQMRSGTPGQWTVTLDLRLPDEKTKSGASVQILQQERSSSSVAQLGCVPKSPGGSAPPKP
jgi:hypothetical protein